MHNSFKCEIICINENSFLSKRREEKIANTNLDLFGVVEGRVFGVVESCVSRIGVMTF